MDISELRSKIEHYRGIEADIVACQAAAKTDAHRFKYERARRIIQVLISGLLSCITRELYPDDTRRLEQLAVHSQATA